MRRNTLEGMPCPVARGLSRLGDPWSLLILRDAYYGITRFDEWERSLGIASNVLTARLKVLVEDDIFERHRYSMRPPRDEYRLTEAGWDARSVVVALLAWGNRHMAPEGASVIIVNSETGELADPVMVDRISGRPISDTVFQMGAGPAAGPEVHRRLEEANLPAKARAAL